jgi:hypothetical protein
MSAYLIEQTSRKDEDGYMVGYYTPRLGAHFPPRWVSLRFFWDLGGAAAFVSYLNGGSRDILGFGEAP